MKADHDPHGTGPRFGRVLLIGLDGATYDVLNPLMQAGKMPNLKAIIADGVHGPLESTRPPITPAAWTTFMTGKGPGRHGIIDFVRYDPKSNRLEFNNNQRIAQQTIWKILSDKDYRVGSINVPMTYPPEEVNGFMISGFDTPPGQPFTHPPELQGELLSRYPDYTHEKKWERTAAGGLDLFKKNLEYICQSFDRGYELARFCGDKYGWDVMMVLFKLVDNLQHKAWKHLDERTRGFDPQRADLTENCFARLDVVLGKLRELADEHDATILIMSDHGHGSLDGKAQPNLLLREWGYLGMRSAMSRAKARGSSWLRRLSRSKNGSLASAMNNLEHDLAFDWSRTKACVLHAGIYGFLYINLKGRQPQGIVDPKDYERLRSEIQRKLQAAQCKDRDGRPMHVFTDVYVTEELYNCERGEHDWMPDLLLAPAPGLAVVKKIRGSDPVRWIPLQRLEGTHRLAGVFAACGPRIARGKFIRDAHIADIAPTLLAGLEQRVPKDMEGRVLTQIFDSPIEFEYEPPQKRRHDDRETPVLSESQLEEVAQRLGNLGYMD